MSRIERYNNFDIIRLVAAILVVYSHSFVLTGVSEPNAVIYRSTFGGLGVAVFLMISGFFVSMSWDKNPNFKRFLKARFLRIMPGLATSVLLCVFIVGPLVTTLSLIDYFHNWTTVNYFRNIFMYLIQYNLPGVFENNPYPYAVNGSLWTLCYEVTCYLIMVTAAIGVSKNGFKKYGIGLLVVGLLGMQIVSIHQVQLLGINLGLFFKLFSFFAIGCVYYEFKDKIPMKLWIFAVSMVVTAISTRFGGLSDYGLIVFGSYILFYFGLAVPNYIDIVKRVGDLSYGTYIYGFPIQQLVTYYSKNEIGHFGNFAVSLIITLAVSYVSWHMIEKRFLQLKNMKLNISINQSQQLISWIHGIGYKKQLLFLMAFAMMLVYLVSKGSMTALSRDADETWKVAATFFDEKPFNSYVMYKGIWSFVLSIGAYWIEKFLGFQEFFIYKVFNSLIFAYIATIGIPQFWSHILKRKIEWYEILIETIMAFTFLKTYFSIISVDAVCVAVLVLCVNQVARIRWNDTKIWGVMQYIGLSATIYLLTSFSGQYSLAAVALSLYVLIDYINHREHSVLSKETLIIGIMMIIGVALVKLPDMWFTVNRIDAARRAGEWMPTARDWLQYALTGGMLVVDYPTNALDIRGAAILINEGASIDQINGGYAPFSIAQHFQIALKYPVEFLIRWLNRLFMGITYSLDNRITSLLFGYTFLYFALLSIKQHCATVRDLFNKKTLLFLAWILPALIPCLMHTESRYFLGLNFLIISAAIFAAFNLPQFGKILSLKNDESSHSTLMDIKVNYTLMSYFIFVLLCLMVYAGLTETLGIERVKLFVL